MPFPSPGDLPNPGLLHCRWILLPAEPQGKLKNTGVGSLSLLQQILLTQEWNPGLLHGGWLSFIPFSGRVTEGHRPCCSPFSNVTCTSTQGHLLSAHSQGTIKASFFQQTLIECWFCARPSGSTEMNEMWSYPCLAPRPMWDTAW